VTQDEELGPPHEGVEEWMDLVDEALNGLHHALNNRIGSLSALVELHQLGELPADGPGFGNLAADVARLEDCSRLARLLPRSPGGAEEPLILDDVLADVFAIHRFLHEVRDVQVTIVPARYVEPVRVERWALVRVLALLLNDAKRLAKPLGSIIRIVTESDEQWVRVEFGVGSPHVAGIPVSVRTDYADRVATSLGASVLRRPGVAELRLPTLKSRRAADRR
jgi:hypothetical protein